MQEKHWNKIAKNYHEEIVSPFYGKVKNPLLKELEKIQNKKNKTVAEFGCGFFYLGDILSKSFKKVHASDFAEKMIVSAKEKNKKNNVTIKKEDIRKVTYKEKFDIIITVNSLLIPSRKDLKKALKNIFNALKKNGAFFMIVPSMEAVLYHGLLLLEQEKTVTRAKRKFEIGKYDLFLGHHKEGKEIQKFYYRHEIIYYLKKAGFKNIRMKKVLYPWDKDASDYQQFPKEDPIWDWFVKASK